MGSGLTFPMVFLSVFVLFWCNEVCCSGTRTFDVRRFGVVPDGRTDNSKVVHDSAHFNLIINSQVLFNFKNKKIIKKLMKTSIFFINLNKKWGLDFTHSKMDSSLLKHPT